jgi:hypothetical protein
MLLTNIEQYLQTMTYEDQSSRNNRIVKMCPVDSKLTDVSEVLAASVIAFMIVKKKVIPLHAMEALGRRGGIAPTHSRPRH